LYISRLEIFFFNTRYLFLDPLEKEISSESRDVVYFKTRKNFPDPLRIEIS